LRATLAPPVEFLTVGHGAPLNSHPTFRRPDTSFPLLMSSCYHENALAVSATPEHLIL